MNKSVYITQKIPECGLAILKKNRFNIEIKSEKQPVSKRELLERVRNKDGLICLLGDNIDKDIINAGSNLKIIATYSVGYDNIDVSYASKRGIMVTNTPGVLTDATAELTWALIFACARRIAESDRFIRKKEKWFWRPDLMVGTGLNNKILGIIGAGRIGQAVAYKAKGFNMEIVYTDLSRNRKLELLTGAKKSSLHTVLSKSDFITLHTPLMQETKHLISSNEFALMKPSAYLVNTSRGAVVNEKALVVALKSGQIAGAGLDVYENEPKVNPALLKLDNVVLLPHIGSATKEARDKMATMVAENVVIALSGKQPPNLVNH
ncbi:MAG: D-glycerate dehydrogenase [Planctomycetes bacterium]|nr:D-glycerate dehydrogenase [Planctomycetota bacterium]